MMFPQGNESQPSRQAPNHVTPLQFSATSFFLFPYLNGLLQSKEHKKTKHMGTGMPLQRVPDGLCLKSKSTTSPFVIRCLLVMQLVAFNFPISLQLSVG